MEHRCAHGRFLPRDLPVFVRTRHGRVLSASDLFASEDSYYIHPLKVYKRHSQTMFLPHSFDPASGKVLPLLDRESVSRYYAIADREKALR